MSRASLLRERPVRALLLAETISVAGSQMTLAPLGALAAGPALEAFRLEAVLVVTIAGSTVMGLLIGAAVRDRARDAAPVELQPA